MRDANSFDDFYRSTSARALRYGRAVADSPVEAQDLVQEAYARAWRQWAKLAAHPAPEAWLRLVISRLATDRWRRLRAWRLAAGRTGPPDDVRPPGEETVLLVGALRQLPARQRQALALHYLFDMSVEEIAREAGVPTGTVKSWLARGRARLAALLPGVVAEELEVNDVA
ncbi:MULTISPECIES: RNA polymerase sigma factor [Micromonospora]|uniref:RNA polymerase sigma factor n=1 Tax=Micromonospora solifontis TaxID=2487138 RepID=A0ABX9WMC5_9ACTN|nr:MULTISPECIES: sigma-70 family RNA polymerase sigma factor [Micromonospora]NES15380.1 sigma-70 family RNA polymerase sigma factor [Micromonospora sp. PPF5-17B]NES36171.1 sigma-70 family RNA polymerase sigma factor [Micromonospora solifontis]NES56728.1 sigma-70 family RNA polymerase sigma factor [Micromonospora sp. PPF5-6]RNL99921.1 sigma-70 family RNA polymerase sigma factor [Micromonospora solifontis]